MFIAVEKVNLLDGTDVRLLKFLAKKFRFVPNITVPDTYFASVRLVCINTIHSKLIISGLLDNPLYSFYLKRTDFNIPYINKQVYVCFSPAREI